MLHLIRLTLNTLENTVIKSASVIDHTLNVVDQIAATTDKFVTEECADILSDRAKERAEQLKLASPATKSASTKKQ